MKIEYTIKGITLDVCDLLKIHKYYEAACTAEYIMENHNIIDETEAMKLAHEIREQMDKYGYDEDEAIEQMLGRAIDVEVGDLIAVNGNLYEYGGIEKAEYSLHKVYVVDVDEEGILTSTGITCCFTAEELKDNEVEFTKSQWYGIVEHFIRQDYDLEEEEIYNAVYDIVDREFVYGRPTTIEALKTHIAVHMNR